MVVARDRSVVAEDVRRLTRSRERLRGFIGSVDAGDLALVFPRARQVHTFGMRFPIDVLFLDAAGIVVHIVRSMKPRRVSRLAWRARSVVEVGEGRAAEVAVGDRLVFERV